MIDYSGQGGSPTDCGIPTFPIGSVMLERHVVDTCLDGQYDGQDAIIYTYSDGSLDYQLKALGSALTVVGDPSKVVCHPDKTCIDYVEVYRLDGNINPVVLAVPERPVVNDLNGVTVVPASTIVTGNELTISGAYKSFVIKYLPDAQSQSVIQINEVGYRKGDGKCASDAGLPRYENGCCCIINQELKITAHPGMHAEIIVTRSYT